MILPAFYLIGLVIALLSGAAGLAHEMLWTRRLVDLLGGTSEASTRVLSLFFLGLSCGAVLARSLLVKLERPWRAAALAEFAIAILALPAVGLPFLTAWIWPTLGVEALSGLPGIVTKWCVASLVIVPPATAMGTTLPFFVSGLLRWRGSLGREGIWIYGLNTAGGVVGLLVVGAWLLPSLGVWATMWSIIGLNVTLAAACLALDQWSRSPVAEPTPSSVGSTRTPGLTQEAHHPGRQGVRVAIFAAAVSGAGLLASEIVVLQAVMLVVPVSFYGPLAVLVTVVSLLAIAAPIASRWARSGRRDVSWWLPRAQATAGLVAVISPLWYFAIARRMTFESADSVLVFSLKVCGLVLSAFGPLFLLLGFVFPLSVMLLERSGPDVSTRRWPWLLAVNGVGGVVGAELAYRGLLPSFGVHVGLAVVGVGYIAAAAVTAKWLATRAAPSLFSLGGAAFIAIGLITGFVQKLPQMNPHLGLRILSEHVGADGLVAVVEGEGPGRAILVSNQYMLGSTSGAAVQRRQAHLPLLLHPNPRRVGFIGLATGITPGASLRHQAVEQVLVAEISSGVVAAAGQYFAEYNDGILTDDRSRVLPQDGRTVVAAADGVFDVLIADLFLPWGSGASRLYSTEHFEAARRALRQGGLFCQWLPMYQLTEDQFLSICATFQASFPSVHLFRNDARPHQPGIALVGSCDDELAWDAIRERLRSDSQENAIADPAMRHWEGFAMQWLGLLRPVDARVKQITLNNMHLEIEASRERITKGAAGAYLHGTRWSTFVAERLPTLLRYDEGADGTDLDHWRKLGREVILWECARGEANDVVSRREIAARGARLFAEFPATLRNAIRREPTHWPGSTAILER